MRSRAIKYVIIVLLAPHLCLVAAAFLFSFFQERLPPPHLSSSVSFNEKARWLKEHLNGRCDVLVIGSSMALNNVDSGELAAIYPGQTIINAASWGMSIEESDAMLKAIIPLCEPKTIILPTNYPDFSAPWAKEIAWSRFVHYLQENYFERFYSRGFDLLYLAKDLEYQSVPAKDRRSYESLAFDDTGTVELDCRGFKTDPLRWDAYKSERLSPSGIRPAAVDAISSIADTAAKANSRLVVIATPMRPVAETSFYPEIRAALWDSVRERVEKSHGTYIRIAGTDGFADRHFADAKHLNECGAKKLTQIVAQALAPGGTPP
jgi:hypothetical protein